MPRNYARIAAAGVLCLCGLVLTFVYLRTGHFATGSFRLILLLEFSLALAVAVFAPSWRAFLAGFVTFAAVRIPALLLQSDSHNVLFPFFFGLACGRPVAILLAQRSVTSGDLPGEYKPTTKPCNSRSLLIVLMVAILWVYLQTLRTLFQNYGSLMNLMFAVDRQIAAGVSANYGSHLALSTALALLGPLTWAASEALFRHREQAMQDVADGILRQLPAGIAVGLLLGLLISLCQGRFDWLYSGSADQGQLLGRRPGLLSDTGAAAALLPVGIGILSLQLHDALLSNILPKALAIGARIVLVALSAAVYLAATAYLLKFQGRGMLLNMGGALILFAPPVIERIVATRGYRRVALFAAFPFAGLGIILLAGRTPIAQSLADQFVAASAAFATGGLPAALAAMDPIRMSLLVAGFRMLSESPWFGVGLGGFVAELMRLKSIDPTLQPENPVGFIPGILAETGVVGLATTVLAVCAYLCWLLRSSTLRSTRDDGGSVAGLAGKAIILMPIALLAPLSYGYQIVYPEFCAAFLLPLCAAAMSPGHARL